MRSRREIEIKLEELALECENAAANGNEELARQYQAAIWGIRWSVGDIEDMRLYSDRFSNGGPF